MTLNTAVVIAVIIVILVMAYRIYDGADAVVEVRDIKVRISTPPEAYEGNAEKNESKIVNNISNKPSGDQVVYEPSSNWAISDGDIANTEDANQTGDNVKVLQPVNIVSKLKSVNIYSNIRHGLNKNLNWNRLLDENLKTDLSFNKYQMEDLTFTITFSKPYRVKEISFYQPPYRQWRDYLSKVRVRLSNSDTLWSKEIDVNLPKDSGEFSVDVVNDEKISKIQIDPIENWGGHYVFIGDVKVLVN